MFSLLVIIYKQQHSKIMVNVIGFQKRTAMDNRDYYVIQLQSDEIELLISQTTGRHYATLKKCWMSTTFDEQTCKLMLGKKMPGTILKEECDPYSFVIEETGEEMTLNFRNVYSPVESEERKVVGELLEA